MHLCKVLFGVLSVFVWCGHVCMCVSWLTVWNIFSLWIVVKRIWKLLSKDWRGQWIHLSKNRPIRVNEAHFSMNAQGELWLKLKCASFAEGDQRAVSYWPHLQLLQLAGEGLLRHSLRGPREAAGKSWFLSGHIWGSHSGCGILKRFLWGQLWCILVLMVIDGYWPCETNQPGMSVCVCWSLALFPPDGAWQEKGTLTLGLSRSDCHLVENKMFLCLLNPKFAKALPTVATYNLIEKIHSSL